MRPGRRGPPRTVDEYFDRLQPESRAALQRLRRTIRAAAPEAEEVISYRMPAFKHHGMLVYYAAFKDHLSLFVGSPAVRRKFARELKPFAAGKGTVHFTRERSLPAGLVTRIVRARVAENEGGRPRKASAGRGARVRTK